MERLRRKLSIRMKITSTSNNNQQSNVCAQIVTIILSLMFIVILLSSVHSIDTYAQTDKDPAFLDAYWTDNIRSASTAVAINNSIKKEVGPGEGASTLAVVLVNKGRSDITAVTGYLTLPSGFKPNEGQRNSTAVASFDSIVKPGESFTLYFDVYILKQAKAGAYSALLKVKYSKILEVGEIIATLNIPFRLPGKVILDTVSQNRELIPGIPNELNISIHNEGSANATGVIITVSGIAGASSSSSSSGNTTAAIGTQPIHTVNLGNRTFDIGTIPADGTVKINPVIYPSNSAGETVQNLDLQISYGDAYGNKKTFDSSVGLVILPNPPESVLSITSNNTNNNNVNGSLVITAGKIQDLKFTITNNGKKTITDMVISLDSQSESLKILGDSRWILQSMIPHSKQELSTKVFASENMVGNPTLFRIRVQYISEGQSEKDSLELGAYIGGEIKIRLYDLAVNYIGDNPNLSGNLLNEGNTVALFTTMEMMMIKQPLRSQERTLVTSLSPQQYLGDLTDNSPLPFSIPLKVNKNTETGVYPVVLKITYKDNLRIPHELIINGTVNFEPKQQSINKSQNIFGLEDRTVTSEIIPILIAIATAAIVSIVIIIRKQKSRTRLSNLLEKGKTNINDKSEDIEPLLDNIHTTDKKKEDNLSQS